jgi:Family of unknown function (DUF6499)
MVNSMRKFAGVRLPAAYRYMTELEPSGWAWEFLRRNPDYRAAALRSAAEAGTTRPPDGAGRRWGLQSPGASKPPRQ